MKIYILNGNLPIFILLIIRTKIEITLLYIYLIESKYKMDSIDGIITINYLDTTGKTLGSQQGLMMSFHHQTFVFSPFEIDQTHFTHATNINLIYKDNILDIISHRIVFQYFLRVWEVKGNGINPATEMTINFPNKNHFINNDKIDIINKIEYNGWHIVLPSLYFHQINSIYKLGSIIYTKNKITGMVINNLNETSIIISMYFLKQIMNGIDLNYANLYYGLDIKKNEQNFNEIYVKDDWEIYSGQNKLEKNDILLSIDDNIVKYEMYNDKIKEFISIDTWITLLYYEKSEIIIKVNRNNNIIDVIIPRIPIHHIMQIKYFSSDTNEITFGILQKYKTIERYVKIGKEILENPKKIFV